MVKLHVTLFSEMNAEIVITCSGTGHEMQQLQLVLEGHLTPETVYEEMMWNAVANAADALEDAEMICELEWLS